MTSPPQVEWGVFGGSGFYDFLDDAEIVEVSTPYGPPSSPVAIGAIDGRSVAFIARHGRHHEFAAHRVPYRANMWVMHALGVRSVIAPCSVGSLQRDIHPGQFVVVDQLVDRTWGRADTYHDVGGPESSGFGDGGVHHQAFAEPYSRALREQMVTGARRAGADVVDGGTMVVINGPRFSTRAESQWFRTMGWQVVNMTGYPEAVLAAELGIRYGTVALVTDYDAGVDGHEPVTMDRVFETMHANVSRVRRAVIETITTAS